MPKSSPLEKQAQQWLPKPLVVAEVSPPQQAVLFSWEPVAQELHLQMPRLARLRGATVLAEPRKRTPRTASFP